MLNNRLRSKGAFLALILVAAIGPACSRTEPPASTPLPRATATLSPGTMIPSPTATAVAGGTLRPPTPLPTPSVAPRSQRVGWIVFSSYRDGVDDLYLVSPDGDTPIPMGLRGLSPAYPAWSPDWQQIAFATAQLDPVASDIYVVDAGCVDLPEGCLPHARNLTGDDPGLFSEPAWSPDGRKIAYSYRASRDSRVHFEIWVMDADGSNRTRLTDIGGWEPAWSPDGKLIAFTTRVVGDKWGVPGGETQCLICGNVFIMQADGSTPRRLTDLLPDSGEPAWSPDGTRIALTSAEGHSLQGLEEYTRIYTVSADGAAAQRLTAGERHGLAPSWSPDGARLVFEHDGRTVGLFVMIADGSDPEPLTDHEADSSPGWKP